MTCKSYSPDLMAMGDCQHCGHTYESHMENENMDDQQTAQVPELLTRPSNDFMDAQINETHRVLDHGEIRVVDYMGDDAAIVQAARVSYGKGTKTPSKDESLIRYLLRRHHTTPLEMCEIKLHVKLPVFVARQWIRHRTANVNEYSARYSILDREFYIPESKDIMPQSSTNAQGRNGALPIDVRNAMRETLAMHSANSYDLYEELTHGWPWFNEDGDRWIDGGENYTSVGRQDEDVEVLAHEGNHGMARELARMVCTPNIYTSWYWKVDLHNLLNFLRLRADPHAQMEIRVYADAICQIVKGWCPMVYQAFEDYVQNSVQFSAPEIETMKTLMRSWGAAAGMDDDAMAAQIFLAARTSPLLSEREQGEFQSKLSLRQ